MSDETIKMIAAAIIAVAQVYAMNPGSSMLATFWDMVATICGGIANILAWWAMYARRNYFEAVTSGS